MLVKGGCLRWLKGKDNVIDWLQVLWIMGHSYLGLDRWTSFGWGLGSFAWFHVPLTGFELREIQRDFLHGLGLALMMGRLVVLWPFRGLSSRFHWNRPESSFIGLSRMGKAADQLNPARTAMVTFCHSDPHPLFVALVSLVCHPYRSDTVSLVCYLS